MGNTREVPLELVETVRSDPDAIDPEEIEELLEDDWEEMRNTGLKVLVGLAADNTDRIVPFVEDIIDCLDESYGPARSHAALALSLLAADRPDLVEPAIPKLVDNLDDETPKHRFRASRAVAEQLQSTPESFVEHADTLIDTLVDGPTVSKPKPPDSMRHREHYKKQVQHLQESMVRSKATREVVANVLVEVAREEPTRCADRLSDLLSALDDDVPHVRGGVVEVIKLVAKDDPDAVEDAIDPLVDLLEDDVTFVRARAIQALGFADATTAIEPLRTVAESDDDEDIQELAAETADWLEEVA